MSKSLIQVVNQSTQAALENSIINIGSTQRRYGCDLRQNGNGIQISGCGYYMVDASVSVAPTAAGNVTVALYDNGVQVQGGIAYGSTTTAGNSVALPIVATIRRGCNCNGADDITLVLVEGAGDVKNVSLRIEKS